MALGGRYTRRTRLLSSMDFVISWPHIWLISYSVWLVSCTRYTADFTFYTHRLSWNEARQVCEQDGGSLLETQHDHVYDFVQEFKTSDPWENYAHMPFWIGIFVDNKLEYHYRWSSNCEVVSANKFLFDQTMPVLDARRCVAEEMNSPGSWKPDFCTNLRPFVCLKEETHDCETELLIGTTLKETFKTAGQVTQLEYFGSNYDICEIMCKSEPACWAFVYTERKDCFRYSTSNMTGLLDPANYEHTTTNSLTLLWCHHAFVNTTVFSDSGSKKYIEPEISCMNKETPAQTTTTAPQETTTAEGTRVTSKTTSTAALQNSFLEEKDTTEISTTLKKTNETDDKIRSTVSKGISWTTGWLKKSTADGLERFMFSTNSIKQTAVKTTASSISSTHFFSQSTSQLTSSSTTSSTSEHTSPLQIATDVSTSAQSSATVAPLFPSTSSGDWQGTSVTLPNASFNMSDEFCMCGCYSDGMTKAEKKEFIAKILKELTKDKANFSSSRRRYISVMDERPSAQNVGVVGVILLTVAFGGIILLDLSTLGRDLSNLKKNIQSLIDRRLSETI